MNRRILLALAVACIGMAVLLPAAGVETVGLYLAPALLLLLALGLGLYPGERALIRKLRRARAPRRRPLALACGPRRGLFARWPRGGRLIAVGMAGRAPPLGA
jgi:hypothetical protein